MRRAALLALGLLALAACGKKEDLKPAMGQALPRKPASAPSQPGVGALLATPSQAVPARNDDLVTKSRPLQPDRFDLPPPG